MATPRVFLFSPSTTVRSIEGRKRPVCIASHACACAAAVSAQPTQAMHFLTSRGSSRSTPHPPCHPSSPMHALVLICCNVAPENPFSLIRPFFSFSVFYRAVFAVPCLPTITANERPPTPLFPALNNLACKCSVTYSTRCTVSVEHAGEGRRASVQQHTCRETLESRQIITHRLLMETD